MELLKKYGIPLTLATLFAVGGFFLVQNFILRSSSLERPVRQLNSLDQVHLKDSQGRSVALSRFSGKPRILYMGYSHCPDMCPLALSNLSRAMKRDPELQKKIQAIFISVDPERDSPERLAEYEKQFAPLRLSALGGEEEQIQLLATDLGASYQKVAAGPGASVGKYGMNHSLFFYFIDSENRLVATLPSGISPDAILEASRSAFPNL
ncbi:MAG: SCO family protein [Leptospiraceae bacterium]|nr:SCO family protein [Leptospiraceae bacterium]